MKVDAEGPAVHLAQPSGDEKSPPRQRQEIENRLAQAEESREWLLEVFAAHIHRLSQPLTALQGIVELALLNDCSPAECRAVLEDSLKELDRLRQNVSALRDLTETERDSDAAGRPLPLIEIVGRTAEVAGLLAESLGAKVEIETRGDFHVFTRAGRLERALHEVIHMALRRLGRNASLKISFSSCPGFACVTLGDTFRSVPSPPSGALASKFIPGTDDDEAGGWEWSAARRMVKLAGGRFEVRRGADSAWAVSVFLPTSSSNEHC